jgi:hypothetical protein
LSSLLLSLQCLPSTWPQQLPTTDHPLQRKKKILIINTHWLFYSQKHSSFYLLHIFVTGNLFKSGIYWLILLFKF